VPVISFESDIQEAIERYYTGRRAKFEEAIKDITDEEVKSSRTRI
jgi:hypothetical protein